MPIDLTPSKIIRKVKKSSIPKFELTTLREYIMYFFIKGGRIYTKDFKALTGLKSIDKEFKKYIWCYSNNGYHVDVLNELLNYPGNIDTMDLENTVQEILNTFHKKTDILEYMKKHCVKIDFKESIFSEDNINDTPF